MRKTVRPKRNFFLDGGLFCSMRDTVGPRRNSVRNTDTITPVQISPHISLPPPIIFTLPALPAAQLGLVTSIPLAHAGVRMGEVGKN